MIRKFIAIAALCLASTMVFSTVAMAQPAPDICALDLSQPVTIDHALQTADMSCAMIADVATAVSIGPGDGEDVAAGPCSILAHATITTTGHRQHEDPGRCSV